MSIVGNGLLSARMMVRDWTSISRRVVKDSTMQSSFATMRKWGLSYIYPSSKPMTHTRLFIC